MADPKDSELSQAPASSTPADREGDAESDPGEPWRRCFGFLCPDGGWLHWYFAPDTAEIHHFARAYARRRRLVLFASTQRFHPRPDAERIDAWKRVSGYYRVESALPHLAPFYFDLDCDGGLDEALNLARYLTDFLVCELQTPPSQVQVFFSGSKGAHVLVEPAALGIQPSVTLTRDMKAIALRLCKRLATEGGAPRAAVDDKVYSLPRMLREENPFNPRSGLYKVRLTLDELRNLSTAQIQELAKAPRVLPPTSPAASVSAKACAWWREEMEQAKQPEEFKQRVASVSGVKLRSDGFIEDALISTDSPDCIQRILRAIAPPGQRNRYELQLASWSTAAKIPEPKAVEQLARWIARNRGDLSPGNARTRAAGIIHAARSGNYGFSCAACRSGLHTLGQEPACGDCKAVATGKRQLVSAVRAGQTDLIIPRITLEEARERTYDHALIAC